MAGQVIDFDRWRAEHAQSMGAGEQPPVFRIGGVNYPMPIEPPATIAVDVIRLKHDLKDGDASVPIEAFVKIGEGIFGADVFREMCVLNSIGAAEMGDVILQAFSVWQNIDVAEGEARPNRRARRAKRSTSSKTGRS